MEFIREHGGINDPGGDLASMGMPARLIRETNPDQGTLGGISGAGDYGIDTTLRAAIEAGTLTTFVESFYARRGLPVPPLAESDT